MSATLRRFNSPTRWMGVPIQVWLTGGGLALIVMVVIAILRPPFIVIVPIVLYLVVAPAGVLALYSWFTGVPALLLLADFLRALSRRGATYGHPRRVASLRGGIVVVDAPAFETASAQTWRPDDASSEEL